MMTGRTRKDGKNHLNPSMTTQPLLMSIREANKLCCKFVFQMWVSSLGYYAKYFVTSDIPIMSVADFSVFLIFLYIHITACLWYMIIKTQNYGEIRQDLNNKVINYSFGDKFFISIY